MEPKYKFIFEKGVFKYSNSFFNSFLRVNVRNIKKIYEILERLDVIYKQTRKTNTNKIVYNDFIIEFDSNIRVMIKGISNWLNIEKEVHIIKRELSKYVKYSNTEYVKDVIVKIKSLKKGSSN